MNRKCALTLLFVLIASTLSACTKREMGISIGAAAGAGIGYSVGGSVGAAAGAAGGALIGNKISK